jgi:hypothetical protein
MSNFTYEQADLASRLERYEWDNVWWERTDRADAPRVLYIGDSISCSVLRRANKLADGSVLIDGFGSSKAVDNPYLMPCVSLVAAQQKERRAVLFNSGLHGWHLDDETEYPRFYAQVLDFLQREFADAPLAVVLTTSVADAARERRVQARNKAALHLAKERGLAVIDLYTPSLEGALHKEDGVHFQDAGYCMLARVLLDGVRGLIGKNEAIYP